MKKAFSLVELVIIIVLMAILMFTGYAGISSYQTQRLRAAAERVASDLRYAQNLAITSTAWQGAAFQVTPANSYNLYETDGVTDTNLKKPEDRNQDFIVNLASEYQGVTITSVNIGGGNKVEFSPYGVPFTDRNGAAIAAAGYLVLSGNGLTVTTYISPESGRIFSQ